MRRCLQKLLESEKIAFIFSSIERKKTLHHNIYIYIYVIRTVFFFTNSYGMQIDFKR